MNSDRSWTLSALVCTLILCALTAGLLAQSDNASISGFVKDASGSSVPNATVIIKNEATGVERRTTTNNEGYFVASNLPPATYTVRIEATGFRTFEQSGTKLDPGINTAVDVNMQVGALTETVQVTASANIVQSETATVGKLVERSQIDLMELNGRNPVLLASLVPGTRGGALAGLSFSFGQGPANFNGSRNPENLITYDGAPATRTRSNGTSLGSADVDSVQEVQVLTANYGAELGRSSGGQIRIITRSGTNQFHGAAFEYFRHDALNANTWSRNSSPATAFVPPFRYNQYGYNIGGPFYIPNKFNKDRNKWFWYWGQEWVKYRPTDTVFQTVPTQLMRQGNFSEFLDPRNVWYGRSVTMFDPTTCPSVGASGCTPFGGNIIPQNRLSPNGIALLRAYPEPNLPSFVNGSNNWYGAAAHPTDQRKDTLSVDMVPSDRHRIAFRKMGFKYVEYQPFDGGSDRTPKFFNRPNQTNSLNWVWTVRPTIVNEALATVSLDDVYIPVDTAHFFDKGKAGINYPYLFPEGKEVPTRIPDVVLGSGGFYNLTGGPYPSHSAGPIYTFSDTLSWIRGSHTFKFGFAYEKSGENDFDQINVSGVPGGTNNQNGRFAFSDTRTGGGATSGVGIGNAAMGLFDVYAEIGRRSYTLYRGGMYEAFASDSWKVSPKLHLDYGVRWSVIVPYRALWNNMDVFDPKYYDPAKAVRQDPRTGYVTAGSGDRYNGIVIPGSGFPSYAKGRVAAADTNEFNYLFRGEPDQYSTIQYHQFQPRIGIAYSLNDKTVIRSGVGRYYTRLGVSDSVFLGGNPPFQPIASVSLGRVDNPGGGAQNLFPLTFTTQSKAFKNPEAWNWNLTLERQTILKSVVSVAYVGRRGLHLQQERDINQLAPGTLQANPGINPDYLRPYKGFAVIRQTDNVATSIYNSFQLAWTRRFTQGLSFSLAYTLSKSFDDGSAQRDILPNSNDRAAMWGPSDFDTRHTVLLSQIYELPIFRDKSKLTGKVLGGWQISGIEQFQTGTPASVGTGDDFAGVGTLGSMSGLGQAWLFTRKPEIVGGYAANGNADPTLYFQTKNPDGSPIFNRPAAGTFAPLGARNLVFGPGFQNWNLGLFKKFAITERTGFQFRAEGYNFINHPNWGGPNRNPTSQGFGKVTSKSSERNLQLSLRVYF
jgi:hypothetical protein